MSWRIALSKQRSRFWRWTLVLSALTWCIGWCLMIFVDVETVIGSGPILFLLGVMLLITQIPLTKRSRATALLGGLNVLLPILFTSLVNLLHWSPSDAELPFGIMGSLAILITVPLTRKSWQHSKSMRPAWLCQHCGYPLINLTSETCPECGEVFDIQVVNQSHFDSQQISD